MKYMKCIYMKFKVLSCVVSACAGRSEQMEKTTYLHHVLNYENWMRKLWKIKHGQNFNCS